MKTTLLLVDDNKDMLDVLVDELTEKYNVLTALNGQQALELLSKEVIQLVISDVMMPVMDGFELCKIVKSNFEYSHIPVILLTAKNTLQSKIEGLELGADAYIEKPFELEYLLVQIANLLANRNKIKEYFAHSPVVHLTSVAPTRSDEAFLDQLYELIQANLDDPDLDIDKLAKLVSMSRSSLFRKIKFITDLTPNEIINLTRLKKGAELLVEGKFKIYEISDMVGYNSQTNFGRNFLKQFHMTPSEYQKQMQLNKTKGF